MLGKIRTPAAAGQFYDAGKESLEQTIKNCFLDERGPQTLPELKQTDKKILGVVVPHAGYIYSGAIAAHSFYYLTVNGFADTFIILGPNHTGLGSGVSIMTQGAWQTPLGKVSINEQLAKKLRKDIIDEDETAHQQEHSIEVQLPFLQYCAQKNAFDFVPISMAMQDYQTAKEIGEKLASSIEKNEQNVSIIASSDFSHAGMSYMSMPPAGERVDKYAEKQDEKAIDQILKLDPKGLIETVKKDRITMCGYGPVASMLVAAKKMGAKKAELLKYGTSYEVHPGSSCVGYGAIVIY